MKNIVDLYTALNTNVVNLNEYEGVKNSRLKECENYYQCVQRHKTYIEKYQSLSAEISENFDRQRFNLHDLQTGFAQIGSLDGKLATLQISMGDIQKFLRPQSNDIALLPVQYYENLVFRQTNDAISKVDSVFYDLQEAKENAEERRLRRKENWKTAGKVAWTIIKWAGMIIGFVFVIIAGIIKIFASSRDDN